MARKKSAFTPGSGSDAEVMAPKPQKPPRKLPEVPMVPEGDGDFLMTARHRLENAFTAESRNRIEALEDLRFIAGDQWPVQIRSIRLGDNRPCLTIPRINTFYSQIVSDLRKNRPAIQVDPVGSGADIEKAQILQGIIGHIEYISKADLAYDSAAESASGIGFGFVRLVTEYKRDSFDQQILIKPIYNHFSVYGDPDAKTADWSDCNYCFVTSEMNKWVFTQKYPEANPESVGDLYIGTGDNRMRWWSEESVRIAEYYWVEETKATLCLLSDGSSKYEDELEPEDQVEKRRSCMRRKVKWCLMTGSEVLEGPKDWAGKYIPIVPMWGKIAIIEGQPWRWGMIRQAKDSQRMYNYWASAMTEHVALSPKAPFMGTKEQIQGYETEWMTANTKNVSFLPYKPTKDSTGNPIPPPQRIQNVPVPDGIVNALSVVGSDMQFVTGIFNPGLGQDNQQGPESGKAVLLRQTQSDDANFIYADNQHRMLRMVGIQLIDLIPKILTTQQDMRIISPDGDDEIITVNQPQMNPKTAMLETLNDLTDMGDYDVRVEAGPSHATQRQQAADAMMALIQADPQAIPIVADQLMKNLDFPGAQILADRFAKMMPVQLTQDDPLPPGVQAQFKQMQDFIGKLQQQMQQVGQENDKLKLENRNKVDENQTKRDIGFAQIQASLAESFASMKTDMIKHLTNLEHDGAKHGLSESNSANKHLLTEANKSLSGSVAASPRDPMTSPSINEPNDKGVPYGQ